MTRPATEDFKIKRSPSVAGLLRVCVFFKNHGYALPPTTGHHAVFCGVKRGLRLTVQPVAYYVFPQGRENAFGMILYAAHVILPVADRHNLAVVALRRNLQTGGEGIVAHHPTVVSAHYELTGQTAVEPVGLQHAARSGYAVEYVGKVLKPCTEHFGNGLMTEADAEDGLSRGILHDDTGQKTRLGGNARSGTEQKLVEWGKVGELELIVAHNRYLRSKLLHEMHEIVSKTVVIVYNGYFHNFAAFPIAALKAPSLLFTS